MLLSAAFHFFSPFHCKKKYHNNFSLQFISFSSFHFHPSVNSHYAPIFVILLYNLNITKNKKVVFY